MPDRNYSAQEIDALRAACMNKTLYGYCHRPNAIQPRKATSAQVVQAEEMVRTYMQAGLTAADLKGSA